MKRQYPLSQIWNSEPQAPSFSQGILQVLTLGSASDGRHLESRASSLLLLTRTPVLPPTPVLRLAASTHSRSLWQPVSTQSPSLQPWNSGHCSLAVHGFLQTLLRHCSPSTVSQSVSCTHWTQAPALQMRRGAVVQSMLVVQESSGTQRSSEHLSVHRFTQSGSEQIGLLGLYCGLVQEQ